MSWKTFKMYTFWVGRGMIISVFIYIYSGKLYIHNMLHNTFIILILSPKFFLELLSIPLKCWVWKVLAWPMVEHKPLLFRQSPSYYTPIFKSANGYILKGLPVLKILGYQDAFIPLETYSNQQSFSYVVSSPSQCIWLCRVF